MAVRINANSMSLGFNNRVVATARLSEYAAAGSNGAVQPQPGHPD
jgi:hypothetical protein